VTIIEAVSYSGGATPGEMTRLNSALADQNFHKFH